MNHKYEALFADGGEVTVEAASWTDALTAAFAARGWTSGGMRDEVPVSMLRRGAATHVEVKHD